MLRDGVEVEHRRADGSIAGDRARLVSDDPDENDWLVVNQFTVIEGTYNRRPDIVAFINGLPIAALEIKSALDDDATIWNAWNQLQTYQMQPTCFAPTGQPTMRSGAAHAVFAALLAWRSWAKQTFVSSLALDKASLARCSRSLEGIHHRSLGGRLADMSPDAARGP